MTVLFALGFADLPVLSAKDLLSFGIGWAILLSITVLFHLIHGRKHRENEWLMMISALFMTVSFALSVIVSRRDLPPPSAEIEAPEACDLSWQRGVESDNIERYSRGKEMCGYMSDDASLSLELCNGMLPPGTFDPVRNCEELQSVNIAFGHWLNRTVPLAMQECDRQGIRCHSYLHSGGPIP